MTEQHDSTPRNLAETAARRADGVGDPNGGEPIPSRRVAGAVVVGLVALLALCAVLLAVGSLAAYGSVKARLDSFASDGDADLSRSDFDAIVIRLRLAAVGFVLTAAALGLWRRKVARVLSALAESAAISLAALSAGLVRAIREESWAHWATLGLVTGVALLVRIDFLLQPMRYDESVTFVHYASRPWYIALTTYTAPNNHVFHSLLVHLSTLTFGGEPWAIRLPAFTAGVLLVPASYIATRVLYGKHAGLLAAGLVAGSSVLVEYSTNARGYTLVALVTLLLIALATRLSDSWSPAEWLAFSILAAIGFFTVPVMLYAFGGIVLWLVVTLWSRDRRLIVTRLLPSVITACALTAILYAPIVASSGLGALTSNEFVRSLPLGTFADRLPHSLGSIAGRWNRDVPLPAAVALAVAAATAVVLHRRISPFGFSPALAMLLWTTPVVAAQRVVPFERVWLFLLPVYLLTAAAGIVFLLRPLGRRVGGMGTVAVGGAILIAGLSAGSALATRSVAASEDTSTFRDGQRVAALLATRLEPRDKVLVAPPADAILEYWLGQRGLDPAALLYWNEPGTARRILVVVKEGPRDYPLRHLLADPRLAHEALGHPRLLRRFQGTSVYELLVVSAPNASPGSGSR